MFIARGRQAGAAVLADLEQTLESTIVMINLFGAVALLLFGLAQVKDRMPRAFGARLGTELGTGTRNGLHSFVSGFIATLALMTASFVERDLIRLRLAQIVLRLA